MAEFVSERVYQVRAQMNGGKVDESQDKLPMLQRLMEYSSTNQLLPDNNIISESMGHMIATSDITSTSLFYFFWELFHRPNIAKKLNAELDAAMPGPRVILDISVLSSLPYLNAFIRESLQVYSAALSLLERVIPSNTSKILLRNTDAFDLMGYALPPGTIVGTQAWSMHHDPSVFPPPETFLPDRWLSDDDEASLTRMNQHLMSFGFGTRVSGGQNLAQMMLKIVIVAVVRSLDVP